MFNSRTLSPCILTRIFKIIYGNLNRSADFNFANRLVTSFRQTSNPREYSIPNFFLRKNKLKRNFYYLQKKNFWS